jgi:hypothetical protein
MRAREASWRVDAEDVEVFGKSCRAGELTLERVKTALWVRQRHVADSGVRERGLLIVGIVSPGRSSSVACELF